MGIITEIEKDILSRAASLKKSSKGFLDDIIVRSFDTPESIVQVVSKEAERSCIGILTPPTITFPNENIASPVQRIVQVFSYRFAIYQTNPSLSSVKRNDLYSMHDVFLSSMYGKQFQAEGQYGFENYSIEPYDFSAGGQAQFIELNELVMILYQFSTKVRFAPKCESN